MKLSTSTTRLLAALALAALAAPALLPVANAHGNAHPSTPAFGTSVGGIGDMKAQGVTPAYALVWATKASGDKGFDSVKKQLAVAKSNGVTPVVQWYYWGDSISVNCIEYGCDGRSKKQWESYAYKLAYVIQNAMGGKLAIVVLETEFNKNGVQWHEAMDGYLAKQSWIFRNKGMQTAIGFGNWAHHNWERFDRAVSATQYISMQTLRSAYRQSDSKMLSAAEDLYNGGKWAHGKFGKRILVTDFAVSTWKGKEWIQRQEVKDVVYQKSKYTSAGVVGFVYRWMKDVPTQSWGHHGYAEKYWGVKYSDGRAKPAFWDWIKGVRGTSSAWGAYNG